MKIKQIDFYINEDHRRSGLAPVMIDTTMDCKDFHDLQEAAIYRDYFELRLFKTQYALPDAVAAMHIATDVCHNECECANEGD